MAKRNHQETQIVDEVEQDIGETESSRNATVFFVGTRYRRNRAFILLISIFLLQLMMWMMMKLVKLRFLWFLMVNLSNPINGIEDHLKVDAWLKTLQDDVFGTARTEVESDSKASSGNVTKTLASADHSLEGSDLELVLNPL